MREGCLLCLKLTYRCFTVDIFSRSLFKIYKRVSQDLQRGLPGKVPSLKK